MATLTIHSDDQDGTPTLFVRSSGSSPDEDPRQMKLATDDGRAIDPETHEAIDKTTGEVTEAPKKPKKNDSPKGDASA